MTAGSTPTKFDLLSVADPVSVSSPPATAKVNDLPMEFTRHVATHILTVSLEDYYQGAAFRNLLSQSHWSRFEKRVQQNTDRTLLALERYGHHATFFVSSWLAEQVPGVIQKVVAEGHEIGSAGVTQSSFRLLTKEQLRAEARTSKQVLEDLTGRRIRGFRVADHRLRPEDLSALEVLAEEGYEYDSSVSPSLTRFSSEPKWRSLHKHRAGGKDFYELPLPAFNLLGLQIPIAGGNYLRQIPQALLNRAVNSWIGSHKHAPFIFYFRIWDLDPEQPEITGASRLARLRHYRNALQMPALLEGMLSRGRLIGASEYLGWKEELLLPQSTSVTATPEPPITIMSRPATASHITVVVPCYNESNSLSYLAKALYQLEAATQASYRFKFIFVDDGSQDGTWSTLQQLFSSNPDVTLLRHESNRGITAAILSGARAASTEFVCSIDCDCTYDPLELANLIPLATAGVDCVTASPYHPQGQVLNLPRWRRFISTGASRLYRVVLGSELHTFTSCFRIYRRSRLLSVTVKESGFVGIAELLGKLHLEGAHVTEYPTTLAVRFLGRSKMKLIRNTALHLRLLAVLASTRAFRWARKTEQSKEMAVRRRGAFTWLTRSK